MLEHAAILSDGKTIQPEDLPRSILRKSNSGVTSGYEQARSSAATSSHADVSAELVNSEPITLREMEERLILRVLDKYQGDKPKAAKELGIALKTLYNRLSQMGQHRHAG